MNTPPSRALIDGFGRRITYLRVSVTDRCDLRCRYCMAEHMTFAPGHDLLTLHELEQITAAFIRRGVTRLRLTGGEPLMRRGLTDLAAAIGQHLGRGLDELTLTTNGSQLRAHATALAAAGIRRVNISLDTLDPARFAHITRRGRLAAVLDGIAAAREAGLAVKINMVALAGLNEDEIEPMLEWCAVHGHGLTLIETMPLGDVEGDRTDHYLPLSTVRARLDQRWTLRDIPDRTGGPARYVRVEETGQQLGFITPLTNHFCATCNRVRLTATGTLFLCLGQSDSIDLRAIIRSSGDLDAALDDAMRLKPERHDFTIRDRGVDPAVRRHMSVTGG